MNRFFRLVIFITTLFTSGLAYSQLSITKTTGTYCTNGYAVFQLGGVGGGCASYNWGVSGGTNGVNYSYSTTTVSGFQVSWYTAGTYTIYCNYNCSGSGYASTSVTITSTPTAYTVGAQGSAPYCSGGSGITVTLSNSQTGVNYTLSPGGTVKSGSNGLALQWPGQTAAGNYTISGTNSNGCYTSMNGNVVVNASPTSAVLSGTNTICSGTSANLSVAISGGTAPYSFTINGYGSVSNYTSGSGISVSPGSTTSYTLGTVTDSKGCTVAGTGGATVTVNPAMSSAVLSGTNTICSGTSTNLSVAITGGTAPYSFTINGYGAVSNYTSGSGIPVSPSSTTSYTLGTVTDSKGCTVAGTGGATVTIGSSMSSAVLSGTTTICSGTSTNLSVAITGGTAPYSFTINGYGSVSNYTSGSGISVSPGSTTSYTLGTVTDSKGCTVGGTGGATVTVNPTATSAILSGTNTICSGTSTNLSVAITGGTGPFSFTINGYGAVSNYTSGAAIPVSPGVTTSYTIGTVTGANGCTVGGTGGATVTVNPTATSAILSGTATICSGTSTNLSVAISGGTGPYSFTINGYGAVSNYTSGSGIPVSPGTTTSYTLGTVTDSKGCTVAGTGGATVTVNPRPTAAVLSGTATICAGTSTNLSVAITGGTGPFSFTINGYGPVSNYTSGSGIPVNPGSTTSYSMGTVTDSKGCTVAGSGGATITVIPLPSAITGVAGLAINFLNEPSLMQVSAGPVGTSYQWSGGTITDASGTIPGQKVLLKVATVDANVITVTPVNNGCLGSPFQFTFTGISGALAKTDPVTLPHSILATTDPATGVYPTTYFDLPKHNPTYTGCINQLSDVTVNLVLDMGDNYNLGANPFNASLSATVTAYSDLPGVQQSWNISFSVNQNTPEQFYKQVINVNPQWVRFIQVQVNSYTNTVVAAQNSIRLSMWTEEKDYVNITSTAVTLNSITPTADWEQTFTWNTNCADVSDYVFQLLRIYGGEAIDWNKALSIETESNSTTLQVTMAEGSGNYVWRVIPIGNQQGGIANPLNWGTPSGSSSFVYTNVDDGTNWIYSRTFTEGNKVSEQLTYANGLQQVSQQETRIQGINQVVASQTLQDYAGRNALVSLPVPTGVQKLGYVSNLLKKSDGSAFKVSDFDADATLRAPTVTGDYNGYYSGTDVSLDGGATVFNGGVASAQGYPYSRTLFGPDGRVQEQAGVGLNHSVAGGKTVKTYYSNPSIGELVRLFGSEAPDVKSVQKVTTFDANGTASISYKTKDGKVIATALEIGNSTGALNALPSAASATISLYEEVSGYEKLNNSTITTRKPMFFAKPTTVALDYQITPTLLKELCASGANVGLTGYYPFDGNAMDQSVTKNNGTVVGTGVTATTDAMGTAGSAYNVVATSATYLQIPDGAANDFGTSDFTISFWVKKNAASTASTNNSGLTKWNSTAGTNEWAFQIGHGSPVNNIPHFAIESGTTTYDVSATTALALNTWYNLTAVRSGSQLLIYVNGTQQGSLTIPAGISVNNVGRILQIGRDNVGNYTNAAFDELQIYNRALSSSEVTALQNRGTTCKTCDYKIDLLLYQEGVDVPQTLASQVIQAGNCVDQTSLVWDPTSQNVSFNAATKYTLEKRITLLNTDASGNTYLSNHLAELENKYRTQITGNNYVTAINGYLTNNDMAGLKTYLTATFQYDATNKFYIVPVGSTGGCSDFIYVPDFDLCPVTPTYSEADCKRYEGPVGKTFSEYFISYYTGNSNVQLYDPNVDRNGDGQFNDQVFLSFNNLNTNQPVYFGETVTSGNVTVTEFDQMVVNMKTDNSLTCATLWPIWETQVKAFEASSKIDLGTSKTAGMGSEATNYQNDLTNFSNVKGQPYNLYETFIKAVEGSLQANFTTGSDICANRPSTTVPYFIMNTQLYGYFRTSSGGSPAVVAPDLSHAYRMAYYNETVDQQIKELKFYSNYTNAQIEDGTLIPSQTDFDALSVCDKHKFAASTLMGAVTLTDADIQTNITRVRGKCFQACEARAGEFRVKVINSIMSQNTATIIEHYNTYIDPYRDGDPSTPTVIDPYWIGVRDVNRNVTGFTLSECELDAMVDALVQNCEGYCNTSLTPQDLAYNGKTYRVYGTDAEQLRIKQVMTYDCDVIVQPTGATSCQSGYDFVGSASYYAGGKRPIDPMAGFQFGTIATLSDPSQFDSNHKFVVTKTTEPTPLVNFDLNDPNNIGTFRWAIQKANTSSYTGPFLIYFNLATSDGITLVDRISISKQVIIDGNTQPPMGVTASPKIKIKFTNYPAPTYQYDPPNGLYFQNSTASGSEIKGIQWETYVDDGLIGSDYGASNLKIIGNIFKKNTYNTTSNNYPAIIRLVGNSNSIIQNNIFSTDLLVNDISQKIASEIVEIDGYHSTFRADYNLIGGPTLNHGNVFNIPNLSSQSVGINDIQSKANYNTISTNIFINGFGHGRVYYSTGGSSSDLYSSYDVLLKNRYVGFGGLGAAKWGDNLAPTITSISSDWSIVGTTYPNATVEIFASYKFPDANRFLVSVTSDNNGNWSTGPLNVPNGYGIVFYQIHGPYSNSVVGSYYPTASCSNRPLCFKFTTPKTYTVTIPTDMANYVYNPQEITCSQLKSTYVSNSVNNQIEQIINNRKQSFSDLYYQQCGDMTLIQDKLSLTYTTGLHHFTLYYYDRAGNLLRTVPPEGVSPLTVNTAAALATAQATLPQHLMVTEYQYNSLGQLRREHSPDGTPKPNNLTDRPAGTLTDTQLDDADYYSSFIYSSKSLLRFSRNAKQKDDLTNLPYSYTKYDALGRVIEVGEATGYNYNTLYSSRDAIGSNSFPVSGTRQVTSTVYSTAYTGPLPSGYVQDANSLNNRVSYTTLDEDPTTSGNEVTTVYNYDAHGNVKWLVQIIPGMDAPRVMEYDYDLISGKVNQVKYNSGQADQFFHKYDYDANNRITTVYTSRDGQLWQRDARYEYYLHGPLKRTTIGEDQVQGVDYTYTIHGWLKAMNHAYLDITSDPNKDANGTSETARDAFGMALGYYTGDYLHSGSTLDASHASTLNPLATRDLYNGNIGSWSTNAAGWKALPQMNHQYLTGQQFTYDELNRIVASNFLKTTTYTSITDYNTSYSYSANGNIKTATATGFGGASVDNLTYSYPTYSSRPLSNLLQQVTDAAGATSFADDVEAGQAVNNYQYDAIGNLVADLQQGTAITWTPYGKVKSVTKASANTTTEFTYDAAGNRVIKKMTNATTGLVKTHFYVRDASGNIMAVYEKLQQPTGTPELTVVEIPIYGSDRIGRYTGYINLSGNIEPLGEDEVRIAADATKNAYEGLGYLLNGGVQLTLQPGFNFTASTAGSFVVRVAEGGALSTQPGLYTRKLKDRQYELKDHLGNVRVVVSDLKNSTLVSNVPGTYEPDLLNINHYYPFGMDEPGRTWSDAGKYRYGFNGKEKDNEGEWGATAYDYGFRIYNPSIGKFLSVDPLTKSYPMLTPYQFASNGPIEGVDLDGLERYHYTLNTVQRDAEGKVRSALLDFEGIERSREIQIKTIIPGWVITKEFPYKREIIIHTVTTRPEGAKDGEGPWGAPVAYKFKNINEAYRAIRSGFSGIDVTDKTKTVNGEDMYLNSFNSWSNFMGNVGGGLSNFQGSRVLKSAEAAASGMSIQRIGNKLPVSAEGKILGEITGGKIQMFGKAQAAGEFDFVVTMEGKILIGRKHSYMSGGADVQAAGTLKIRDGKIVNLDNASGHYAPNLSESLNYPKILEDLGVDLNNAHLRVYGDGGTIHLQKLDKK